MIAGGTALSFSGSYKDLGMDPTTDRGAQFDLSATTLEQVHNLIHAQDDNTKKKYLAHLVVAISESTRFKFLTPEIAKIVKDNSSFKLTDHCTTGSIGKFYDNIHDWNGLSKGGSGIVRVRAAH